MLKRLGPDDFSSAYRWAKRKRMLSANDASAIFVDLDVLDERLDHLLASFPAGTLHAVAVKTNPLLGVLRHIVDRGFGLEAASFEEVLLAIRAGVRGDRLVWDSPVKRRQEIDYCDLHFPGMIVNANCLEEVERLKGCRNLRLGLRINPLVHVGAPGPYAVSHQYSKFGVPIDSSDDIIKAFCRTPRLVGLHVHAGSEMTDTAGASQAIAIIFKLASEIEGARKLLGMDAPIDYIDIGGGLPVEYRPGPATGLEDYLGALRARIPELSSRRLVTEYGRFVHAHCGWVVSRIEYELPRNDRPILLLHHGADMFVREVYSPHAPRHRIFLMDDSGQIKQGDMRRYSLGGPLCFAGDFIENDIRLPTVTDGDSVVIADAGANTYALWSKHCSRVFPKVIGYSSSRNTISILKRRQSPAQSISFWA